MAAKHVKAEALSAFAAACLQASLHSIARKVRMIVLLAQMTEPDVAKTRREVGTQELGSCFIAQMPVGAHDALLKIGRVRPLSEHVLIMVRLKHQIVRRRNERAELPRHMPRVGDEAKGCLTVLYAITHIVTTVVRHVKRSDLKIIQSKRPILIYIMCKLRLQFRAYTEVAAYSLVDVLGGIDGKAVIVRQCAHTLDVVGMVVRDKDGIYSIQLQTCRLKTLFQSTNPDARVDQNAVTVGEKKVTIAVAPASQTYKSHHIGYICANIVLIPRNCSCYT